MEIMDAIYGRRAVRAFEKERVGHAPMALIWVKAVRTEVWQI